MVVATVRGAEPSMQRAAMDRRGCGVNLWGDPAERVQAARAPAKTCNRFPGGEANAWKKQRARAMSCRQRRTPCRYRAHKSNFGGNCFFSLAARPPARVGISKVLDPLLN
jgi:hypothetical protein